MLPNNNIEDSLSSVGRVKNLITLDLYINSEWVKEITAGRKTVKQAIKEAEKVGRSTLASVEDALHVHVFVYFGALAIADLIFVPAKRGVNIERHVYNLNMIEAAHERYAVCWGEGYKEESGESNAIAVEADKEKAKEIAESESTSNNCIMSVVRLSDSMVVALYNNTHKNTDPPKIAGQT